MRKILLKTLFSFTINRLFQEWGKRLEYEVLLCWIKLIYMDYYGHTSVYMEQPIWKLVL